MAWWHRFWLGCRFIGGHHHTKRLPDHHSLVSLCNWLLGDTFTQRPALQVCPVPDIAWLLCLFRLAVCGVLDVAFWILTEHKSYVHTSFSEVSLRNKISWPSRLAHRVFLFVLRAHARWKGTTTARMPMPVWKLAWASPVWDWCMLQNESARSTREALEARGCNCTRMHACGTKHLHVTSQSQRCMQMPLPTVHSTEPLRHPTTPGRMPVMVCYWWNRKDDCSKALLSF
jgi:hypothetical protein